MQSNNQAAIMQLNKNILQEIVANVDPIEFNSYYKTHNRAETRAKYGIRTDKQLIKILKLFNYDFSFKKSLNKGKPSTRSHDSYVLGGEKSAKTQKINWAAKSEEEKNEWSRKQSIAHLTSPVFKEKITASNRAFRKSLTQEQRDKMDKARSESMKAYWDRLTEAERQEILDARFVNGVAYHTKNSLPNLKFKQKLEEAGLIQDIDFSREVCFGHKAFDFVLHNKIAIEINPTVTHNSTWTPFKYNKPIAKDYHKQKSAIAAENGLRCIHVFDWDDQDKIIRLITNNRHNIYGRECKIKEVSKEDAMVFLNENHLQNYARDSIRIGLYSGSKLVSIMTFGKPRYNKNYEYELIRYCSKENIIGGAQKLFKFFIKTYNPASIISYCDLSKFSGDTYTKLNFKIVRINTPSKHWYNLKTKEHYLDSLVRQQGFSRVVHHCDASTDGLIEQDNNKLMLDSGFVEVYDCGQATYGWVRPEIEKDSLDN